MSVTDLITYCELIVDKTTISTTMTENQTYSGCKMQQAYRLI